MKESYTVFKKSILQLSLISKLYVWVYQTIGDYNLQMIETAQTTHSDTILKNVSQLLNHYSQYQPCCLYDEKHAKSF